VDFRGLRYQQQIAPGRYTGEFRAAEIGASKTYSDPPRAFGFGIPHTEEFNATTVNEKLLADLAATTNGRVLSIENVPPDLFRDLSDSKESKTPLWPYFIPAFLLLLIADVAVRKFLDYAKGRAI
jgi:hypothetical protein